MSNIAVAIQHGDSGVAHVFLWAPNRGPLCANPLRAKSLGKGPRTVVSAPPVPPLPDDVVVREGAEPMSRPPHIRALLLDAFVRIREVFGDSVMIAIDRFSEPESSEAEDILYIVIGTDLGAAAASTAYDRLLDEWWLDNVGRGRNQVHLSLELL